MKKLIIIPFLLLNNLVYSAIIHINNEDEIKKYAVNVSIISENVFIIPMDLLASISDENKKLVNEIASKDNNEFAGTTYTEVILPVLIKIHLEDNAKEQVKKGKDIYQQIFGKKPSIFYPYMGIMSEEARVILEEYDYNVCITTSEAFFDLKSTMTISQPDLSRWIEDPIQKLVWEHLKKAQLKLIEYESSDSYDKEKYQAALEEIYSLEKPIWFENYVSYDAGKKKENDLWFRAGLSNVYRIIAIKPPSEISIPFFVSADNLFLPSPTTNEYIVFFNDESDKDIILSSCNIISFGVQKSTLGITFNIFVSSQESEVVDIYIDMNKKNNAGETSFLLGHKGFTDMLSAWEYAISVSTADACLYRYNHRGFPTAIKVFSIKKESQRNLVKFLIPETYIRGNPANWGYIIAGFLPTGDIFDIIGNDIPLQDAIIQVPALRMK